MTTKYKSPRFSQKLRSVFTKSISDEDDNVEINADVRFSVLEERIQFRVYTFDLDEAPNYCALSYTWGPRTPVQPLVETAKNKDRIGRTMFVRQNLYDYLVHGLVKQDWTNRPTTEGWWRGWNIHKETYYWIDQICIDQSNTRERNEQVRQMNQVYRQALWVDVWLGPTKDIPWDYIDAVNSYHYNPKKGRKATFLRDDFIRVFCMNKYWNRLWILQELVLALDLTFRLGNATVIGEAFENYCKHGPDGDHLPPNIEWIMKGRRRNQKERSGLHNIDPEKGLTTIFKCLDSTADCKCEDPRDKVFGVQSLIAPGDRIAVDYAKSVQQVFFEQSVALIVRTKKTQYEEDLHKQFTDICRCLYFMGRGMGVVESTGWAQFAHKVSETILFGYLGCREIPIDWHDGAFQGLVAELRSVIQTIHRDQMEAKFLETSNTQFADLLREMKEIETGAPTRSKSF